MDATALTNLEFSVLLAGMTSLENLTLQVTPKSISNYNLPKPPFDIHGMSDAEFMVSCSYLFELFVCLNCFSHLFIYF